jgi:hypothetical protein
VGESKTEISMTKENPNAFPSQFDPMVHAKNGISEEEIKSIMGGMTLRDYEVIVRSSEIRSFDNYPCSY